MLLDYLGYACRTHKCTRKGWVGAGMQWVQESQKYGRTVYGDVKEEIPKDTPKPLGKRVIITTYQDANLLHDIVTGKSVTAILHFVNTTPTDWFSKRQATVETATYGSEFVAAKTATEQIMDLRNTLRYPGVPIMSKAYMFGDNKSVVTSSDIPQSILNERHNMLSYHRVWKAIAAKILEFHWCSSNQNRHDILSKHWNYMKVKDTIRELFDSRIYYPPQARLMVYLIKKGSNRFTSHLSRT